MKTKRSVKLLIAFWVSQICCASLLAQVDSSQKYKNAAPKKCWAYMAWFNGPDVAVEGNGTQALLAEPEVKAFVEDIKKRAGLMAPALLEGLSAEKKDQLHSLSPLIVSAITNGDGCMFVEKVALDRDMQEPPEVEAAMMVEMGEDAEAFADELAKFISSKDGPKVNEVSLAGGSAYRIDFADYPLPLIFGAADGACVMATGESAFTGAISRSKAGKTPAWLTAIEQRSTKLKRVDALGYLNNKQLMRSLGKVFGPTANIGAGILGTKDIEAAEMIAGLNDKNSTLHVLLKTDEPKGLVGLFAKHAVSDSHFENIPKDSIAALMMTVEPSEILELVNNVETMMGGGGGYQEFCRALKREIGVDLEGDLIDHLGRSWTLYNGADDGWLAGLTLVGEAKHPTELQDSIERTFQQMSDLVARVRSRRRPRFFKQDIVGDTGDEVSTIYSAHFPDFLGEPSVCIKGNRVYLGLFPQSVKTAIKGLDSKDQLFDQMEVQRLKDSKYTDTADGKLVGFGYIDAKQQLQITYPFYQFFKSIVRLEDRGRGSRPMMALMNGIELPPARTVLKHVGSTQVVVRASDAGIELELNQSLPTGPVLLAVPISTGMLLPAVSEVRGAARNVQTLNQLRQIALACLNYESAFLKFPQDAPVKKKDNPKLSWRVHILPFIEENNLYDQFRFDEPWDSEHNKALIEKMPDFYRAASSKAKPGMTVFRGFKSAGILGEADKRIGFGNITDGTSNTILAMEVGDEYAVPWTKPGALDTEDFDMKKLFGNQKSRGCVFADGSSQRMSSSVDKETLVKLFQMNDGEIVDRNEIFDGGNRRRNARNQQEEEVDERFIIPGGKIEFGGE